MTKLEEEIFYSMHEFHPSLLEGDTQESQHIVEMRKQAIAAAEVAKRYIEKALDVNPIAREQELCGMKSQAVIKDEWLKDNGVI